MDAHFDKGSLLITEEDLLSWVIEETDDWIVFNKPGWVVCHPSKNGPWSSLVGAARVYYNLDKPHLVSRLDRETSGVVIIARNHATASQMQKAFQQRYVDKRYLAVCSGILSEKAEVSKPLGPDKESPVFVKQCVTRGEKSQKAQTSFKPLFSENNRSLVQAVPHTGRKHQIRAHAQWLGHSIIGDKIYGPDANLYLEFIENGWTQRHEDLLGFPRQALHAQEVKLFFNNDDLIFKAPLPDDMIQLIHKAMPSFDESLLP